MFLDELNMRVKKIDEWIRELSPKGEGLHEIIYDSCNYSISAGGKRLRPLLVYSVAEMLGADTDKTKHFACAVEFIHTYSLIHDDLPCMDNDDLRRGLPTNHIKYGEAIALLAGDSLLTYAFETASESSTPPDITLRAINMLSKSAGIEGMIGGQVIDIKGAADYEQLKTVHKMKTGALIKLSCCLGGLAANCDDNAMNSITEYAENIGIAFQIKDDILDVESTSDELGKPIGSDEKRGIQTYVTLFGADGAREKLQYHTSKAKKALECFNTDADFLIELSDYLLTRKK